MHGSERSAVDARRVVDKTPVAFLVVPPHRLELFVVDSASIGIVQIEARCHGDEPSSRHRFRSVDAFDRVLESAFGLTRAAADLATTKTRITQWSTHKELGLQETRLDM